MECFCNVMKRKLTLVSSGISHLMSDKKIGYLYSHSIGRINWDEDNHSLVNQFLLLLSSRATHLTIFQWDR